MLLLQPFPVLEFHFGAPCWLLNPSRGLRNPSFHPFGTSGSSCEGVGGPRWDPEVAVWMLSCEIKLSRQPRAHDRAGLMKNVSQRRLLEVPETICLTSRA